MDKITICDLAVLYHVGVPDEERARPQRLLLTVEMQLDMSSAAARDDLARTVDYYAVCQKLQQFGVGRNWKLIETVAEQIAQFVLATFEPASVAVEVKKFIVPETRYISVRVERSRFSTPF
ncbi:MAG: dihydroneopterin aldolase [Verrucomicrobiota bacterium]